MNTRWHDLTIDRLEDGGIHLEQQSGVGDPNVIHLHPAQLRHVAEMFGLVAPHYPASHRSSMVERRLRKLTDKIVDFADNTSMREDIVYRCGDGIEYLTLLDTIVDLALEFIEDLGEAEPAPPAKAPDKPTGKASPTPTAKQDFELTHPV
jgi:hypothetical protein